MSQGEHPPVCKKWRSVHRSRPSLCASPTSNPPTSSSTIPKPDPRRPGQNSLTILKPTSVYSIRIAHTNPKISIVTAPHCVAQVFHRAPSPGSDHSFNSPQPNSWSSSTGSHPRRLSVTEENDHWNLTETNSEGHFSQHRMSVGSEAMLDPENYRYCLLADRPTKTISALSFTPKAQSSKVILTAASVVGPCTLAALTQNACASIVGSLLPSTNKPQPQLIPLPSCIHNIKIPQGSQTVGLASDKFICT